MDPQGKPLDRVGIAPRVKIDAQPEDYAGDRDPVLAAALENVRNRAKSASKEKVLQHRPGASALPSN
jgi:C-terminal processing protease CtpA/Prc